MKREVELQRRLRALLALQGAVAAMKALSAQHVREVRRALQPARTYRQGVERILGSAEVDLPAGSGPAALLLVGADLGLCGSYHAQLAEAAVEHRAKLGPGPTFCVGRRAAILLKRKRIEARRVYGSPTGARGITSLLLQLADDLLAGYVTEGWSSLDIVSSRFGGVGMIQAEHTRLLPYASPQRIPRPPIRYVGRTRFVSDVVREYLYALLYDLLLDALASEHGARLVATEAAEKWLGQRAEHVKRHLLIARREASTQELLEIVAGARMQGR